MKEPIFEHEGASEKKFAREKRAIENHNLKRILTLHYADAKNSMLDADGEGAKYAAEYAYRYARELERRSIEEQS